MAVREREDALAKYLGVCIASDRVPEVASASAAKRLTASEFVLRKIRKRSWAWSHSRWSWNRLRIHMQ